MPRFSGKVGYELEGTLVGGVWTSTVLERVYKGDVLDETRSIQASEKVNDDYRLQDRISIVADAFSVENIAYIKYVVIRGTYWQVMTVKTEHPRIIMTLGGVYDGPRATA